MIERNGAQLSPTRTTSARAKLIRAEVTELHRRIDRITAETRDLDTFERADIVRRSEEAGAALARLEWALDRAITDAS